MEQTFERWIALSVMFLKFAKLALRYLLVMLGVNALLQTLVLHRLPTLSAVEVILFVVVSVLVALDKYNPPDEPA